MIVLEIPVATAMCNCMLGAFGIGDGQRNGWAATKSSSCKVGEQIHEEHVLNRQNANHLHIVRMLSLSLCVCVSLSLG